MWRPPVRPILRYFLCTFKNIIRFIGCLYSVIMMPKISQTLILLSNARNTPTWVLCDTTKYWSQLTFDTRGNSVRLEIMWRSLCFAVKVRWKRLLQMAFNKITCLLMCLSASIGYCQSCKWKLKNVIYTFPVYRWFWNESFIWNF